MKKFTVLAILAMVLNFAMLPAAHGQQEFEITVHHAPGGPSDTVARILHQNLPANYVVVNRPGALGTIAVNHMLRGPNRPSILVATMPQIFATNPLMVPNISYDPVRDLETVATIAIMPNVLVCNSRFNFKSFDDLKNSKTSLNFAIGGFGSNEHIATALLLRQWNNSHQIINYAQGSSRAVPDLLNGTVDCIFANFPIFRGPLNGQNFTAIMSSIDLGLNVPTWEQTFHSPYPFRSYIGLVVSRNLSSEIKNQIRRDLQQIFTTNPAVRQQIENIGLFPVLSVEQLAIETAISINNEIRNFLVNNSIKLD